MEGERAKVEFDGAALNREFAVVRVGHRTLILWEQPNARNVEERRGFLTIEAFDAWLGNKWAEVRTHQGIKTLPLGRAWRQWIGRRQYRGIEFYPDPHNAPTTPEYYNLWSGLAVEPAERSDPRRYAVFADHLRNNVCDGIEDIYRWVFGYFAHLIQKPRDRPGVALVLRGPMGSGKTKVGEVIGRLFEQHYFLVDDPRYVTGNFNAHMASCLLLQADEAIWAGDKKAEGRLRGLVTSSMQQIEAKGMDPVRLPNYVRLLLTSNEDWVVPAGKDERRFCVLDVNPRCAQNREYFREMDAELANGGLAYLLRDLLSYDLDSVDVGQIPRTRALLDQKMDSFDSIETWWHGQLEAEAPTHHHKHWPAEVSCAQLYSDYIVSTEKVGIKRKLGQTGFGRALRRLVPSLDRSRRMVTTTLPDGYTTKTEREWCYVLPSLADCRAALEKLVQQQMEWPVSEPETQPINSEESI